MFYEEINFITTVTFGKFGIMLIVLAITLHSHIVISCILYMCLIADWNFHSTLRFSQVLVMLTLISSKPFILSWRTTVIGLSPRFSFTKTSEEIQVLRCRIRSLSCKQGGSWEIRFGNFEDLGNNGVNFIWYTSRLPWLCSSQERKCQNFSG